jgi:hypothetical protein
VRYKFKSANAQTRILRFKQTRTDSAPEPVGAKERHVQTAITTPVEQGGDVYSASTTTTNPKKVCLLGPVRFDPLVQRITCCRSLTDRGFLAFKEIFNLVVDSAKSL